MTAQTPAPLPTAAGLHDLVFDTVDGARLRYSLALPQRTAGAAPPLVLVLHYGGPPSGHYGRPLLEQLMVPALAGLDAVFVAPVSLGGDWTTAENGVAVRELVTMLERHYATDTRRRVVGGYSLGGIGTWHFIEQTPEYFSAAIAISGFKAIDPARCRTPVFALHSTVDAIFDAEALRREAAALTARGCVVDVTFLEGIDHFDVAAFRSPLERAVPWLDAVWNRQQ